MSDLPVSLRRTASMIRLITRCLALTIVLFSLTAPGAALAEWRKATTDRLVIYSEGSEADLRALAERHHLECFIYRRFLWGFNCFAAFRLSHTPSVAA